MTEEKIRKAYLKYYRLVMKSAYEVLHDFDYAQDICQEVFLRFMEKAMDLDEIFYPEWFSTCARRKAIDFCKKSYQKHEVTIVKYDNEETGEDTLDRLKEYKKRSGYYGDDMIQNLVNKEFMGKILEELEKQNKDWYEIMVRTHLSGETDEEIARALGITIGNLRIKRHRMKEWLQERYGSEYRSL